MAKLYKTSSSSGAELLVKDLEIAESFFERGIGLLGRAQLLEGQALWIRPCNNIHTMFMKFSIDCIFLDRKLEVKKIAQNVKPFRLVGPFWRTTSVIEAPAGFVEQKKIQIGDHFYVVT